MMANIYVLTHVLMYEEMSKREVEGNLSKKCRYLAIKQKEQSKFIIPIECIS